MRIGTLKRVNKFFNNLKSVREVLLVKSCKMEKNHKIRIFALACLVFGFAGFVLLVRPGNVLADTPIDGQCSSNSDCATGLFCDPTNGNTCQQVIAGSPCSIDSDCWTSKTGLVCASSKCAVPNQTGAGQTTTNSSGAQTSVPTTQSTSALNCPTGLVSTNGVCLPPSTATGGLAGATSLSGFLVEVIKILLSFAGIVAVVMLVVGGYWYMAAGGNEEMAEKGKNTILNFVIGLVVIVLAYTLVSILSSFLTGGDPLVPK